MYRFTILALLAACATRPAPEPAEPEQPQVVATRLIVNPEPGKPVWPQLVRGTMAIRPDEGTIERASVEYARILSEWKLCIDRTGTLTTVEKVRSSGFPEYDAAIRREMANWQYAPIRLPAEKTTACTVVALVYELPADKR
jgi:hypothetical protein